MFNVRDVKIMKTFKNAQNLLKEILNLHQQLIHLFIFIPNFPPNLSRNH